MSISLVEKILGKDEYNYVLLHGSEHSSLQLTNVLKVNMPKIKMLCIDDPTKSVHLEKSLNLEVLLIEFTYFLGNNPVYNVNLFKCKNLKTLIFNNVPAILNDKHRTFLSQFVNNLPETLETIVININIKTGSKIDFDWTTHNFKYINNLPFGLKYFVIFVIQNTYEYAERKFTKNIIKVPFDCRIIYSINCISDKKRRTKENLFILDEYIEDD